MRNKDKKYMINIDLTLTASQQSIWDATFNRNNKYIVCNLSRQQGKTVCAECILIKWFFNINEQIIFITPQKTLSRKIYHEIKDLLDGQGVIVSYNSVFLQLKSITGSTITFFSAEQLNAMRGQTCTKMIIDEAAFMKNTAGIDVFSNIIWPITKVKCTKILMISTPNGKQGFFYDFAMRGLSGENGIAYIKKTIYDDGLINKNEIDKLKKSYPTMAWKQEFECEFISNAISAIEDFEQCFVDYEYDYNCNQWMGIDLSANGSDDTAITLINEKNQTKSIVINGTLDEKYKNIAKVINNTSRLVKVYIENNGIGTPMMNEIMKLVNSKGKIKEWTTTNNSKVEIINLLSILCTNKEILFDRKDNMLYSQFTTFERKISKNGGSSIQYAAREGFKDDKIMSLAIAVICKHDCRYMDAKNDMVFIRQRQKNIN